MLSCHSSVRPIGDRIVERLLSGSSTNLSMLHARSVGTTTAEIDSSHRRRLLNNESVPSGTRLNSSPLLIVHHPAIWL